MSATLTTTALSLSLLHFCSSQSSSKFLTTRKTDNRLRSWTARASSGTPRPPSWEAEEARWLREEQRWLREEKRWLREESRWEAEKLELNREIEALKLEIQTLRRNPSVKGESFAGLVSNLGSVIEVLKEIDLKPFAEGSDGIVGVVSDQIEEKKVVFEEKTGSDAGKDVGKEERMRGKERRTLRKGSEGDDVRMMQEALQKLGFSSGEDDLEYSAFSSGTERAVKTWQASFTSIQDGVMTSELLERLYRELDTINDHQRGDTQKLETTDTVGEMGLNGSLQTIGSSLAEVQETIVKEADERPDISAHRVFLLGENRWEEPSRLGRKSSTNKGRDQTKCLACRGEGHLICTECDGTGEPNLEPQFIEWVDEGAKCPYCGGLGHIICDVCEGKTTTAA